MTIFQYHEHDESPFAHFARLALVGAGNSAPNCLEGFTPADMRSRLYLFGSMSAVAEKSSKVGVVSKNVVRLISWLGPKTLGYAGTSLNCQILQRLPSAIKVTWCCAPAFISRSSHSFIGFIPCPSSCHYLLSS
jgi:hypothetical protein